MRILLFIMAASLVLFLTAKDSQALLTSPTPAAQPTLTPKPTARPTPSPTPRKQRVATQSGTQRSKLPKLRLERVKDFQEVEVLDRRIKIATREGKTKIVDRGVTALVEGRLLYDERQIKSRKRRPINILPSDVKQRVPGARDLKLIDEDDPKYQVTREIKGKIFGMVPVRSFLTHTVNAQTGAIIKQDKPWWWKRFVNEVGIRLDEGEACSLSGPDWCGSGLRCELTNPTGPGTVVPEDGPVIGICRLFPPAFHGKAVIILDESGAQVPVDQHLKQVSPQIEEIKFYLKYTKRVCVGGRSVELPDIEISLGPGGEFFMKDLRRGKYYILSQDNFSGWNMWTVSINGEEEIAVLDLTGARYNTYSVIDFLDAGSSLSLPSLPAPVNGCG